MPRIIKKCRRHIRSKNETYTEYIGIGSPHGILARDGDIYIDEATDEAWGYGARIWTLQHQVEQLATFDGWTVFIPNTFKTRRVVHPLHDNRFLFKLDGASASWSKAPSISAMTSRMKSNMKRENARQLEEARVMASTSVRRDRGHLDACCQTEGPPWTTHSGFSESPSVGREDAPRYGLPSPHSIKLPPASALLRLSDSPRASHGSPREIMSGTQSRDDTPPAGPSTNGLFKPHRSVFQFNNHPYELPCFGFDHSGDQEMPGLSKRMLPVSV